MHSKRIPRTRVAPVNQNPIVPRKRARVIRGSACPRRHRLTRGRLPHMYQKIFHLVDHLAELARAGELANRLVAMLSGIAVAGLGARTDGPTVW